MMKRFIAILAIVSLILTMVEGQNKKSKYGEDSVKCLQNLSTMHEFAKIKVYNYALGSWLYVFDNCPGASKNIYIYGAKIIDDLIDNSSEQRKPGLVDTLMLLYDRRIEYFGQKGYVLGRKGIDLIKVDKNREKEGYEYLKESIALMKYKSEPAVYVTYIMTSISLANSGKLQGSDVVSNFAEVSKYLNEDMEKNPSDEKLVTVKESIEDMFAKSKYSSCENLVTLFEPQYESNKNNIDFLKNSIYLLSKKSCEGEVYFAKAAESLYSLEPSANAAYNLAKLFFTKRDYIKSSDYFKKAIELEKNSETKASYYYQLSLIEMSEFKNLPRAKEYALKAAELKTNWGEPYLLIGKVYAASSKNIGENEFEQSAVFWAAVDMFNKAKNVDPNISAKANEEISKYSVYYPSQEEIFFNGYEIGEKYEVKGWINETTTVRVN